MKAKVSSHLYPPIYEKETMTLC